MGIMSDFYFFFKGDYRDEKQEKKLKNIYLYIYDKTSTQKKMMFPTQFDRTVRVFSSLQIKIRVEWGVNRGQQRVIRQFLR